MGDAERQVLGAYARTGLGKRFEDEEDLVAFYHDILLEAQDCIKNFNAEKYHHRLWNALYEGEHNILANNPFHKMAGTYEMKLPLDVEVSDKVASIQNKMSEYLSKLYPRDVFFWSANERKIVDVLSKDDKRQSRKKIGRLIKPKATDTEDQKRWKKEIARLMTTFPAEVEDDVRIEITTDPLEILRKSSSRKWAKQSCERIGGEFDKGPFSDITNNNAVAFIYLGDNKEPDGRYMLRWCTTTDDDTDVGIEPIMYPRGQTWRYVVYDAITDIMKQHGYGDYDVCRTPYSYTGYSDQMGSSGPIVYRRPGKNNLKNYAEAHNLSRNTALALTGADIATRRVLSENSAITNYPEVVERLLNDDDLTTILNTLRTFKDYFVESSTSKGISCETAKRLMDMTQPIANKIADWELDKYDTYFQKDDRGVWEFEWLEGEEDLYNIRQALAGVTIDGDQCACQVFGTLNEDIESDDYVLGELIRNESVPEDCRCDIMYKGSQNETEWVRRVVAESEHIPDECACDIFYDLARDSTEIKNYVARNDFIPEECHCEIADELMEQGKWQNASLASKLLPKKCDCRIKMKLAEDNIDPNKPNISELMTKKYLAANRYHRKECACDIFKKLLEDFKYLYDEGYAEDWTKTELDGMRQAVRLLVTNPQLPKDCACEILERVSKSPDLDLLQSIAKQRKIPKKCASEVLRKSVIESTEHIYAEDEDWWLAEEMAEVITENQHIPEDIACEILTYIWNKFKHEPLSGKFTSNIMWNPSCKTDDMCNILTDMLSMDNEVLWDQWTRRENNRTAAQFTDLDEDCRCEIALLQASSTWDRPKQALMTNPESTPRKCQCNVLGVLQDDMDEEISEDAESLMVTYGCFDPENKWWREK